MDTLNGFLMDGVTISTTIENVALHNQSHTGFAFNGNCILDSIYISTNEKTDNEILNTSVSTLPEWTPDIKFLASMNHSVDGSNIFGLVDSVTSWSLYRREYQGDELIKVCEVNPDITSWIDYKIEGNKTYEYLLFANSKTQTSDAIISDKFTTTFYGYFLISSDADSQDSNINNSVKTYLFDLNSNSDKVSVGNSFIKIKTFSKFDFNIINDRNVRSGSFSSILIPMLNGKYDFNGLSNWSLYKDELKAFLHDKHYKYFKDKTGEMIKISTEGDSETFSYQLQDWDVNGQQGVQINVPWVEVGEKN